MAFLNINWPIVSDFTSPAICRISRSAVLRRLFFLCISYPSSMYRMTQEKCIFLKCFATMELFMSFRTIILGGKLGEQTSYWSKAVFFLSVKNHIKFSSQNIVTSSQNNVQNYRTNGHLWINSPRPSCTRL